MADVNATIDRHPGHVPIPDLNLPTGCQTRPDGQHVQPLGLRTEARYELPECCVRPAQKRAPYRLLQRPTESKPGGEKRFRSPPAINLASPEKAQPKTAQDQHNWVQWWTAAAADQAKKCLIQVDQTL